MAALSAYLGAASLLLLAVGPLCSHFQWVGPLAGFRLFQAGLVFGVAAGVLGVITLRRGPGPGRKRHARVGSIVGVCVGLLIAVLGVTRGFQQTEFELEWTKLVYQLGYHPFQFTREKFRFFSPVTTATTNPKNPPSFSAAPPGPAEYSEHSARIQDEVYPGIRPFFVSFEPDEALEVGLKIAEEMGWEIYEVRPERNEFEAYATSPVFRFVDDISVRFRPSLRCVIPAHSACRSVAVDLQSRSRLGTTDSGANAERICEFLDRIWVAQGLERAPTWRGCRRVGVFSTGALKEGEIAALDAADERNQEELCIASVSEAGIFSYTNHCAYCVHLEVNFMDDAGTAGTERFEVQPSATHRFDAAGFPRVRVPEVTRCDSARGSR